MGRRRLTTEDFITRAREVHGDRYDYSLVEYLSAHTKVRIICLTHSVFEQTPNNHIHGRGCIQCAVEQKAEQRRLTAEEFVRHAREIHDERYDYSRVEYRNIDTSVKIICPEHGVFKQRPYDHLNHKGCSGCANNQQLTSKEFITRAREIHGDRYDYSLVEYVSNKIIVTIICPEHGIFKQRPDMHLHQKQGCPQCSQTGFNPSEPGTLYVLADDKQCPTLIKIGVTNDLKQRLRQLQRRTPHPVVKLASYMFPQGADAYKLEQEVHKVYHELNAGISGFDGATEWFKYSPEILDYINKKARR